jgi:mycofactocin system creatininase family protein
MELERATWSDVGDRIATPASTLLVPLGATEQHGPHLPLGTDSRIAFELARHAAAIDGAVVAPVLPYGSSGEHQGFAGTLSIGAAATELVLVELGRSACETFDRLLFVNAHGGNAEPLSAAVRRLREEGRDVRAWAPRLGGDAHAGRTETSLMLMLEEAPARGCPAPVRTTAVRGNDAPLAELIDRLRAEGVRVVSPNGVLGDATDASASEGHALFSTAVEDLRTTLRNWPDSAPAGRG